MQGATAIDPIEGDISSRVTACQPTFRFARYGLQGCAISTAQPRNFTVKFAVKDSATGALVTASRDVVVTPNCGLTELPCTIGVCSSGGACLGSAPLRIPINSAPKLTLPSGENQLVHVPHGVAYTKCTESMLAQRQLCERGMAASDTEDGPLTHKVLACPPAECLMYGCPGHEFQSKGTLLVDM